MKKRKRSRLVWDEAARISLSRLKIAFGSKLCQLSASAFLLRSKGTGNLAGARSSEGSDGLGWV